MSGAAPCLARPLAPTMRIRRHTGWQRRYAQRAERALTALLGHADARGQAGLDFGPLRRALCTSPYYAARLRAAGLSPIAFDGVTRAAKGREGLAACGTSR